MDNSFDSNIFSSQGAYMDYINSDDNKSDNNVSDNVADNKNMTSNKTTSNNNYSNTNSGYGCCCIALLPVIAIIVFVIIF